MIYFGEGSDWNYKADGEPGCICDIEEEHHHTVEELMDRFDSYTDMTESSNTEIMIAPDTGEPNIVSGLFGMAILLATVIAVSYKKVFR